MPKTGFIYHKDFLKHNPGLNHPESPLRLTAIEKHLDRSGYLDCLDIISPLPAPIKWIQEIHSREYIDRVSMVCEEGQRILDYSDTGICPDSFKIAILAVGAVITAIDAIMDNYIENAFCAVRPPGHHAERDMAMGFCIFNNVAIATRYIQKEYSLNRVLIIDWDVHHGNGTQNAFLKDPSVLYFSIHQYPHYPGTGSIYENGEDEGLGYTINVPLPPGCGDKDYVEAFEKILFPAASDFKPDFVVISAGFDPHINDPLSKMEVTEEGFSEMTKIAVDIAESYCNNRLVSVLEGGYNLISLATSVESHINVLSL